MSLWEILELVLVGVVAGGAGGLLGIGGSVIVIPAMAFIFHDRPWHNQHLYQGAAMVVNLAVALPATLQHRRNRAIPWDVVRILAPATALAMVLGVFVSNRIPGDELRVIFGVFLLYVAAITLRKAVHRQADFVAGEMRTTAPRVGAVGGVMGLAGGVLGIGGGLISVPMLHTLCRLPLRQCIAASAATMVVSAPIGAAFKVATLGQHDAHWSDALVLALILAPTMVLGGYLGAGLTHRLPLTIVRAVFAVLVLVMAGRMFGAY